ncbi:tape measure protein [Microbacterium phage Zeta1847]|uniref:Tape measure protein n=1 Tax=Microbacterium phage Zeta1847 TaxID=2201444 RepID=A0A2Z4QAU4_9CAUD|nr:tail length tape measure protein [Microbacterium phage Zeta1847]AWY06648.1 tape measure protein [Microbacterium phage Zeta1847]
MAANVIGHATLNVVPSTKGFGKALNGDLGPVGDSGGKTLGGRVGSVFKGVVGPLMAAAGAVGMGMFVSSAIKSAGALEQSIGAINSVFKSGAGGMLAWSDQAALSVGLTRNEFNELGTLIGSQLKNAGTAMEELGPKTNELIGLGADLASMFGGTSKEAVEAISSALKGERDPIERYGVSLKQTAIDAKAAELGFQKVGGALSAEANAAATLALIMEQTTDAHGNFARESGTYEGVMQRLSASWGNVVSTVGTGFLPIATAAGSVLLGLMPSVQGLADRFANLAPVIQGVIEILRTGDFRGDLFASMGIQEDSGIVDFLLDVREAIAAIFSGDWGTAGGIFAELIGEAATMRDGLIAMVAEALPNILNAIVGMAPAILTAAVGSFTSLVTGLLTVIPSLLTAILGMLPSILTTLLSLVPMLLAAGLQLFTGLVQAVITVIPQIVTALVTMLPTLAASLVAMLPSIVAAGLELFMGLVQAVLELAPVLITAVLTLLPAILTTLLGMLPSIITSAIELFLGIVTGILQALPQIVVAIVSMLPSFLSAIIQMLPQLITAAITLFLGIVQGIARATPQIIRALLELIPQLVTALVGAAPQLLEAGKQAIQGFIDGIASMARTVFDAAVNVVKGAIDGVKSFLGIHSPSRLMRGFGRFSGQGLALGLGDEADNVERSALALAETASNALSGINVGELDGGVIGVTADAAEAVRRHGSNFTTVYNDHSTSQEDKQDKLRRAHVNLERTVGASGGSTWRK